MQKIMQNNAAVFRTQETLAEGVELIDECVETFADVKVRPSLPMTTITSLSAWLFLSLQICLLDE